MNKYWQGFAQSMILFNVLWFSTVVDAEQIVVMSNTQKDLPIKIESTNLNNQDYIWQLEIVPNRNSLQSQVKLMNPHPTQKALNLRALELAKKLSQQVTENKYNYAELEKLKQIINDKL